MALSLASTRASSSHVRRGEGTASHGGVRGAAAECRGSVRAGASPCRVPCSWRQQLTAHTRSTALRSSARSTSTSIRPAPSTWCARQCTRPSRPTCPGLQKGKVGKFDVYPRSHLRVLHTRERCGGAPSRSPANEEAIASCGGCCCCAGGCGRAARSRPTNSRSSRSRSA
jgi:hypothetical protein